MGETERKGVRETLFFQSKKARLAEGEKKDKEQ